eukprot:15339027-Ditylum_brightwellii.AAC.1
MIWGIYECLVLAIGVSQATEIFQRRVMLQMSNVKPKPTQVHLDNILAALKHTFEEHMKYLDEILTCIKEAGLQVNVVKSAFAQWAVEYVGFCLKKEGYQPLVLQVQGILDMAPCRDHKDVKQFIRACNFIKKHNPRQAQIMLPLTTLAKKDI